MVKKIILTITTILVVLVGGYIGYKSYNINKYDVSNLGNTYQEILEKINNKKKITITHQEPEEEYINFQNISFKNIIEGYTKEVDSSNTMVKYKNEQEKKQFSISIFETYLSTLISEDIEIFGNENENKKIVENIEDVTARKRYLEENEITNDIELLEFLGKDYKQNLSLFDSINDAKGRYELHFLASIAIPEIKNMTEIVGDYTGYILNVNDKVQEVNLLVDNKRYIIIFNNFTEEEIHNFISSIKIENI